MMAMTVIFLCPWSCASAVAKCLIGVGAVQVELNKLCSKLTSLVHAASAAAAGNYVNMVFSIFSCP